MKTCLTCQRQLKPGTSIPRWDAEAINRNQKAYDHYVAQRKDEIATDKLGLYGEGQFCNKDCATFFARTCVHLFNGVDFIPVEAHQRFAMVARLAERLYKWVADRKSK